MSLLWHKRDWRIKKNDRIQLISLQLFEYIPFVADSIINMQIFCDLTSRKGTFLLVLHQHTSAIQTQYLHIEEVSSDNENFFHGE
jgi:hypothetical protein